MTTLRLLCYHKSRYSIRASQWLIVRKDSAIDSLQYPRQGHGFLLHLALTNNHMSGSHAFIFLLQLETSQRGSDDADQACGDSVGFIYFVRDEHFPSVGFLKLSCCPRSYN